jgi:hypothetical protein
MIWSAGSITSRLLNATLRAVEEEYTVSYLTSYEELARDEARREMVMSLLTRKCGTLDVELRERVDALDQDRLLALSDALLDHGARLLDDGRVVWEEEDYCQPPLAMERAAVLDTYFTDLTVKPVSRGDGWDQIATLPSLWDRSPR